LRRYPEVRSLNISHGVPDVLAARGASSRILRVRAHDLRARDARTLPDIPVWFCSAFVGAARRIDREMRRSLYVAAQHAGMGVPLLNFRSSLHSGFRFTLKRHKFATGARSTGAIAAIVDEGQ